MPKSREDDDVSSSMPSNVETSQKILKNNEISNGDSNSNIEFIDLASSDDEQPADADQTIASNLETNESRHDSSTCATAAVPSTGVVNKDEVRRTKRSKKVRNRDREDFSCGNFVRPTFIPPVFLTIFYLEHGGDLFSLLATFIDTKYQTFENMNILNRDLFLSHIFQKLDTLFRFLIGITQLCYL